MVSLIQLLNIKQTTIRKYISRCSTGGMSEWVSDINSYNIIVMYLLILIKCYNIFTDHLEDPSI